MSISKKRAKEIDAIKDEDIDTSDIPEYGEEFWKNASVIFPEKKEPITIRLNHKVISWFKKRGKGYQSRINSVLESYVNSHSEP